MASRALREKCELLRRPLQGLVPAPFLKTELMSGVPAQFSRVQARVIPCPAEPFRMSPNPAARSQPLEVIGASEWKSRAQAHARRVTPWITPRLGRRSVGRSEPVDDFLFDYYGFRPAHLLRWHPGHGRLLEGAEERSEWRGYRRAGSGPACGPDVTTMSPSRRVSVEWIRSLLEATRRREPHFGCHGLHEWAMVYQIPGGELRHSAWPLRLGAAGVEVVVESSRIVCSHFDAFRFFTPAARPLNSLQPARGSIHDLEQPGCLHANMDLFKWAMKLSPFVPSEIVADCLELARAARLLDMAAGPYDLRAIGVEPVRIEEEAGRAEYARRQREIHDRAQVLRGLLLAEVGRLAEALSGEG